MNRTKWGLFGGVVSVGLLWTGAATADVTGFISDLVSSKTAYDGFLGTWTGGAAGDIERIIVTSSSSAPARIQVFGRCEARICNWGALPARIRTDSPTSNTVRSLSADFNLGSALRHITLHRLPGNGLRFDMVTEFTDGSDRRDYESTGQLSVAGSAAATSAAPQAVTVPHAAVAPQAGVPDLAVDNSMPVAASAAPPTDDCIAIDTSHAYLANDSGNWKLRDFLHVIQNFGPYRAAAAKGLSVIAFYRLDEVCHVGRGTTNMVFFRAAGEVPRQPMGGEDCSDVHADKVLAVKQDDDWKVVDGTREIYAYGSDQGGASQAAAIIRSLNLSRQCFFDRANSSASYWLSR